MEVEAVRKDGQALVFPGPSDAYLNKAAIEKDWGKYRTSAGIIRLPFGIYDYRETYASGLIDYPMPRVDYGWNSVDWGVPGIQWTGGSSKLQLEAAGFGGRSTGVWANYNRVGGAAARLQTYVKDLIIGASHWSGYMEYPDYKPDPNNPANYLAVNSSHIVQLTGIDFRYTRPHLLLRGEMLAGIEGGARTEGFYFDIYYHLPKYEKVTLVSRLEALRPDSSLPYGRQATVGVRYRSSPHWSFAANYRLNNMDKAYPGSWTPYSGPGGAFLFQAYYKTSLRTGYRDK